MFKQEELSYGFGPFLICTKAKLLLKERTTIPLHPKTFELLLVLVQRSGRVVEKDELLHELWPDSFVEESNLTQNIYLLRKALGDETNCEVYIKTVPRRGYRFVAEVREVQVDLNVLHHQVQLPEATTPAEDEKKESPEVVGTSTHIALSRRAFNTASALGLNHRLIAVLIVLSLATLAYLWGRPPLKQHNEPSTIRSLAVLPFKQIGTESQDELLGLGIADAVIIKMSKLHQIPVLPTSSIINYTGRENNPLTVGRKLGVDGVLDGTVQRSGDRIRVTVQLIEIKNGRTLWLDVYDEQFTNIFSVQDVISEHLAQSLKSNLSSEERTQLAKRYTTDTEAYKLYIRGLYFWNMRTKEGLDKAIGYFRQAIEKDPEFALAYAMLGDSYALTTSYGYSPTPDGEALKLALAAVSRALELDETVAEAHIAMALCKELLKEVDLASIEHEYRRAIALNPNSATAHQRYSVFLSTNGKPEGLEEMLRAHELDPLSPVISTNLGYTFYYRHEYDQAEECARKAVEVDSGYTQPLILLGLTLAEKGSYAEAVEQFNRARSKADGYLYQEVLQGLGYTFAIMGRKKEAEEVLAELDQLAKTNEKAQFKKIPILVRLGRMNEAFKLLNEEVKDQPSIAFWLFYDPKYDGLRRDPGYNLFLQQHKCPI